MNLEGSAMIHRALSQKKKKKRISGNLVEKRELF